jgi:hypothetical protein
MAPRSEVLGDRPIRGEKPLGLAWGLEPLHAAFPAPCWLVRVLGAVIQIAVAYPGLADNSIGPLLSRLRGL